MGDSSLSIPCRILDEYFAAAHAGTHLVSLEELLRQADFVSIHCPLTEKTRGLIGARELALMRPDAYLLNTARGGIVDEAALYAGNLLSGFIDALSTDHRPLSEVTPASESANWSQP